jgi:Dual OB-containing domain
MPIDEIVVLACSRKWGGRCVAGISTETGRWLRPVSSLPHGELTPYHFRIDGREVRPLDVVRLEHEGSLGDPSQPENVLVGDSRWQLAGRVDPADAHDILSSHVVEGQVLLGNRGAAVPAADAMQGVEASLALARPSALEFRLEPPRENASRPRPRVRFRQDGRGYDLALTDYVVAPALMKAGLGAYEPADLGFAADSAVFLTVSLAEAQGGWCNKLVAAVLFLPREGS